MFKNLVNREKFISKLLKYNICINSLFYINSLNNNSNINISEINHINSNINEEDDNYVYTGDNINNKTIHGIKEYEESINPIRIRKKFKITKRKNNKTKRNITLGDIPSYDDDSFNSNISLNNNISSNNNKTDIDKIFDDDISIIEKKEYDDDSSNDINDIEDMIKNFKKKLRKKIKNHLEKNYNNKKKSIKEKKLEDKKITQLTKTFYNKYISKNTEKFIIKKIFNEKDIDNLIKDFCKLDINNKKHKRLKVTPI